MLTSWIFPFNKRRDARRAGCASSLRLAGAKTRPRTPISDRWWWNRGVDGPSRSKPKGSRVKRTSDADQSVDAPVVRLVGVSQGGTRDFAAKPDVVELGLASETSMSRNFRDRSVARKPRRETDPNRRNRADDDRRDSVRRTCGTHRRAGDPSTARRRCGRSSCSIVENRAGRKPPARVEIDKTCGEP